MIDAVVHDGRRRFTTRELAAVLATIAVVVVVIAVYTISNRHTGPSSATRTADLTGKTPFSGTPAAGWKPASTELSMPDAKAEGGYTAAQVAGALARTRAYLLAAHTSTAVLDARNLTGLVPYVTVGTPATLQHMYVVELASGNTLAAPVRLTGTVQMAFVPAVGSTAAHLEVTTNLLWAYALTASYPVYAASDGVVTVHENMKLAVYFAAPQPRIDPIRDLSLIVNGDCAYSADGLVGLPRLDDPGRIHGSTNAAGDQFDVHSHVGAGGIGCSK